MKGKGSHKNICI